MQVKLITIVIKILSWMPAVMRKIIAFLLSRLFVIFPIRAKTIAMINIPHCFPEMEEADQKRLLTSMFYHNLLTYMEMPSIWLGDSEKWANKFISADNEQLLFDLLAKKKGLIIAAPHLGNWEVGVLYLTRFAPVTVLYRPPRTKALETFMVSGRSGQGAKLVPTTAAGIKALYAALARGEMIAILPDQQPKKPGGGSVYAPFFGKPALTMTLISRLARKSGAPVVSGFAERVEGGFQGHWAEVDSRVADQDEVVAATVLNKAIEDAVRIAPEQYQWAYKRFDLQPEDWPRIYP